MCRHSTDYHELYVIIRDAKAGRFTMISNAPMSRDEFARDVLPGMLHDMVHERYMHNNMCEPEADELHSLIGGTPDLDIPETADV